MITVYGVYSSWSHECYEMTCISDLYSRKSSTASVSRLGSNCPTQFGLSYILFLSSLTNSDFQSFRRFSREVLLHTLLCIKCFMPSSKLESWSADICEKWKTFHSTCTVYIYTKYFYLKAPVLLSSVSETTRRTHVVQKILGFDYLFLVRHCRHTAGTLVYSPTRETVRNVLCLQLRSSGPYGQYCSTKISMPQDFLFIPSDAVLPLSPPRPAFQLTPSKRRETGEVTATKDTFLGRTSYETSSPSPTTCR